MSHSFDNTLLQRMGFKDSDRKTPAHDRACIEIACFPERLCRALGITGYTQPKAEIERPLQKGDGKYASTVGFIDAILTWITEKPSLSCSSYVHNASKPFARCDKCEDFIDRRPHAILVEVKTKIDGVGDLLRQMNLYREYKKTHEWSSLRIEQYVVWSLDRSDDQYSGLLAGQGYTLIVGPTLVDVEPCL